MMETVTENTEAQTPLAEGISTVDPREDWETEMGHIGLDPQEVEDYADSLQGAAKSTEYLADELAKSDHLAEETAQAMMRYDKALEAITGSSKDWIKVAKDTNRSHSETE